MSNVCLECIKPLWVEGINDSIELCHSCYTIEGVLAKHYPYEIVRGVSNE